MANETDSSLADLMRHFEGTNLVIVIVFLALHGAGLFLVLVNAVVLKCTSGYGMLRIGNQITYEFTRPCRARSFVLCNILLIYHIVLMAVDVVFAVVILLKDNAHYALQIVFWILIATSYFMLACCCIPALAYCLSGSAYNRRPISRIVFDLFNFIVFWLSAAMLSFCLLSRDCKTIPQFAVVEPPIPFTVIPAVITYLAMIFMACYYNDSFYIHKLAISKQEAVRKMRFRLNERPLIKWTIKCGYRDRAGFMGDVICRDEKTHAFRSTDVENFTNVDQQPSEEMFTKRVTKLVICTNVIVGDAHTQVEVMDSRQEFKEEHHHNGSGIAQKFKTYSGAKESYCVTNTGTIPCVFHPFLFWMFTLLGLSLPFRAIVYLGVGHMSYRIRKCVYKSSNTQSATHVSSPQSGEPLHPPPPEPLDPTKEPSATVPLYPGPHQSQNSDLPPDYGSACPPLENEYEKERNVWV